MSHVCWVFKVAWGKDCEMVVSPTRSGAVGPVMPASLSCCSERRVVPASLAASSEGLNSGASRVEGAITAWKLFYWKVLGTKSPMDFTSRSILRVCVAS